jgi:uncharacterized protein
MQIPLNHQSPEIWSLRSHLAGLLLYGPLFEAGPGRCFVRLLDALLIAQDEAQTGDLNAERRSKLRLQQAYGDWFGALAETGLAWEDWLLREIGWAQTALGQWAQGQWAQGRSAQNQFLENVPESLRLAACQDLRSLQAIGQCPPQTLADWVAQAGCADPIPWQPAIERPRWLTPHGTNWPESLLQLLTHYRTEGIGPIGQYRALTWSNGQLQGIATPDPIRLTQLTGYPLQTQTLIENTERLLTGYPALNVLLYGGRGTGKSSLVKALLHDYGDRGLRLIEIPKASLHQLPDIVSKLESSAQKFILFVDDLSFEEDDESFKSLKVVLEGGVTARPRNVVVYATSNRRHLIREFFDDRPRPKDANEISTWDTVQEKLSFSDRFGLTLTFEPQNQDTYLTIVRHLAAQAGLKLAPEELEFRACQWATRHNGRSGRSARQFVDWLQGEMTEADPL